MNVVTNQKDESEQQTQQNITNWQTSENPLAPLLDEQLDVIYELGDLIKSEYNLKEEQTKPKEEVPQFSKIDTNKSYIEWMINVENQVKIENLKEYYDYQKILNEQVTDCQNLFICAEDTSTLLQNLQKKYLQVTAKTDSLHNLSEQLMNQQRILKEKKKNLNGKLHYFLLFKNVQENIERYLNRVNCSEYIELLKTVNDAIKYLSEHINFKESRIYKMKYDSLLVNALNNVYRNMSNIIVETTKQVIDPESKTNLLPLNHDAGDSVYSLYYGKFQNAASKVSMILSFLEENSIENEQYKNIIMDCQKFYVSQRLPILSSAVVKALSELKENNKNDYSMLFRSCGLFIMKTCQDEVTCYHYFFNNSSQELADYLGILCQNMYDILRPSLIAINHVEVLSELCGILQKEMLSDKVSMNQNLDKYVEVMKQLLQDAEERLVFRTNIFFQHDLTLYNPSPGDLAYPEKLEQMENIALELQEIRTESRSSSVSMESQEIATINSNQLTSFRSYTGNSAADLHGMWYPTVKRTLVILSRLYFCLDRKTFQGLAQEGLIICIKTIDHAANLITTRKTQIDGCLFQIKHLLIIREQIAPFQVDFTAKEVSLDFSSVQKAAVDLINNRSKIFTFGSNNALLEFLLEGTPRVKEYLIDSRKEIDKQLKQSCETFITCVTNLLAGNIQQWLRKAEHYLYTSTNIENPTPLPQQDFGKAKLVSNLISEAMKTIKAKIPDVQRSMQLYLANRETEFILFRPIKNNVINVFVQMQQTLMSGKYSDEEVLLIGCPSPEQVNVLICSVSLSTEQENVVKSK